MFISATMESMEQLITGLTDPILDLLPKLPRAILTFAFGYIALYIVQWLIERLLRLNRTHRALRDIIASTTHIVLLILLGVAIARSLGFANLAFALSGSLAVTGIAIGAGANAMIQDLIAGLFLARDRDFEVGYLVQVNGVTGIIKRIDARKVRLEDDKGQIHVFANSVLDRSSWVVIDRDPEEKPAPKKKK